MRKLKLAASLVERDDLNKELCDGIDALSLKLSTIATRTQSILALIAGRIKRDDDVVTLDALETASDLLNELYELG